MIIQLIFGLLAVAICAVCGTVLVIEHMKQRTVERIEAKRIETEERANSKQIVSKWTALYEDEKNKRIEAETRNRILQDQLTRCRTQMAKVKVADL